MEHFSEWLERRDEGLFRNVAAASMMTLGGLGLGNTSSASPPSIQATTTSQQINYTDAPGESPLP